MRILFGCFMFLNSLLAFSADTLVVNANVKNPLLIIKLPANPTTGFQWTLKQYDNTLLQMKSSQYRAPESQLIGAAGVMIFTFLRASGTTYPKSTTMLFSYGRRWEPGSNMLKKVVVNFIHK